MGDVVTIDQLRDLVKADKIKPSDIFGAEVLADDPSVKGLIETENRRAVAGEYAHRKRGEEGFDKTKGELEKQLADLKAEANMLRITAATGKVRPLYDAQKATRKLTEKQATFIEGRLDKFKPIKPEDVEKEFNFYLDSEVDEYGKIAKLMGIEEKVAGGGDKGGGTGPENQSTGDAVLNKYLDPAKNPFIRLA
jgi:ribosomal protein L29